MSVDNNPFRPPVARVYDHAQTSMGTFIPDGRRVPPGNGYRWLLRGWEIFRLAPGTWMGIAVVFMAVMMIVGMIPVVNVAVNLLIPIFIGGISIGCRAIEVGDGLRFDHLFAGFSRKPIPLLVVGLLYMISMAAVVFAAVVGAGIAFAAFAGGVDGLKEVFSLGMVLVVAVVFVAFSSLAMAVWLAPPLVIFHDVSAFHAIKNSLRVAVRNIGPFLVYTLLVVLAAVVASLPLLLGWLVLLPVLYASLYAAYRDMFFEE
ncbi:MAG TPA: BPSS1780 family membrane protein [Accumulibacter sp.]|jgi:uncharacterized membrane protein|nr:BPSS1780 family membrane protein [Accumulibacter sp.]HQC81088.1 BPSS1780 family membrane protein [Accumulibacter sp.]